MNKRVVIGSRKSRLAVIQTEKVINHIERNYPDIKTQMVTLETTGDRRLDITLEKIGGKGLFVKELDKALMENKIDLAVHSLKDMPMEENRELPIVAFSEREDVRDVLVLPEGVMEWTGEGVIGCSSFRRRIQGQRLFPNAKFKSVRGNVLTRLEKLNAGEYDALILAAAGLNRLGLEDRIYRYFSTDEVLPAAGQGILAVQGRRGEDYSFLEDFGDRETACIAKSERAFVRCLDGGCTSPVAAYGEVQDTRLVLKGLYYIEETGDFIIGSMTGELAEAERIGIALAAEMRKRYAP
ncbi:hydroxymethylbilane synthase [Lachnospiraceae bacterium 42-17]|jgi:hydroxymethylbilane synthase|nr:hydroxymethylbilane synthase [Dorea sp.]